MSYRNLVEPIWEKVSIYDGPEVFLRQYTSSPEPSRILLAAHWCQSEVNNGGFSQFFSNSTGVLAPEAVQAFRAIGMPQVADAIQRAMALFGPNYPRDRGKREDALEAHWEAGGEHADDPFETVDKLFFSLIDSENGGFESSADCFAAAAGG